VGAASAEDGRGWIPLELAFRSSSPMVGKMIACLVTAFPDGALSRTQANADSMLHQACYQQIILSNPHAAKMVKILLAFHPETAYSVNKFSQTALHIAAMTDAPQAVEIMEDIIMRYPKALLLADHLGNTPMHIAASVNNRSGIRKLVERSFRRPQHLQNDFAQFPMDCTMNRKILKALVVTPQSSSKAFNWSVTILCTAVHMAVNGLILVHYWHHVL
jgi:hypothetical protein